MSYPSRIKRALIVCDMQADALPSLFAKANDGARPPPTTRTAAGAPRVDPAARREAFVDAVRSTLLASVSSPLPGDNALVIFLGLRFPSRYEGLHPEHSLYGSLRRLNERVGDAACHWFMEGHTGSEVDASLMQIAEGSGAKHVTVWRSGNAPGEELAGHLSENAITDVTIVGAKASQAVQSAVQFVADRCPHIDLSVVREAVADDGEDRLRSMVEHLLPLYCRVASLEEYVEATCGLEKFAESIAKESERSANGGKVQRKKNVQYFANCVSETQHTMCWYH